MNVHDIEDLKDGELIIGLKNALARQRYETARLIAFISEVDARGIYRDHGYSSMFEYAVRALHMSEGEAFPRIAAGRLIRKYPRLLGMLSRGELHLCGIRLAGPELTPDNHDELLDALRFKSKREIECLLAARSPKPDVNNEIRKLPRRASEAPATPALAGVLEPASARAEPSQNPTLGVGVMSAVVGTTPAAAAIPTGTSISSPAATAVMDDAAAALIPMQPYAVTDPAVATDGRPAIGSVVRPAASAVQPLGGDRYKVQFTASQRVRDKLEQARHLLKQQVPDGDLAEICERALDLLIAERMKQRFAVGPKPRMRKVAGKPAKEPERSPSGREGLRPESRHIPHEVRRAVLARDEGRCTFVSVDGRRCAQRGALQFHHKEPYARGGKATLDNIALLCGPHNALRAEQDFGRGWIARRIDDAVAVRDAITCPGASSSPS
jgi:hypothetical protein